MEAEECAPPFLDSYEGSMDDVKSEGSKNIQRDLSLSADGAEYLSSDEGWDTKRNKLENWIPSSVSPASVTQQLLHSDTSLSIHTVLQLIIRFWAESPDCQDPLRFPNEFKKYDISYLVQLPPLDLARCMSVIHLEILFGPVPPDLKASLRAAYWLLQQIHETVRGQWSGADSDANWFPNTIGPLMQKAHHESISLLAKDDLTSLTFQLSQALTMSYSDFLTHRISVIANDDVIFSANWSFNCTSTSQLLPPLETSEVLLGRLLRTVDPLLKSLEVLGAVVGLLALTGSIDDIAKTSMLYDVLPVELNALLSVATHLVVAVGESSEDGSKKLLEDRKWITFGKAFRSIRHRIDGLKARSSKICSSRSTIGLNEIIVKISRLLKPSDLLLSYFTKHDVENPWSSTLTDGFPLPVAAREALEAHLKELSVPNAPQPTSELTSHCSDGKNSSEWSSIMVAALDSDLACISHAYTRINGDKQVYNEKTDRRRSRTSISVSEPSSVLKTDEDKGRKCKDVVTQPSLATEFPLNNDTWNTDRNMMNQNTPPDPCPLPYDRTAQYIAPPLYPLTNESSSSFDPSRPASWEVDHSEVQLEQKVGSGATATVFRGIWRGTEVAVKKMSGQLADPESLTKFQREIKILLKLRHPNLALLMGASVRRQPYFVVMEYCLGGDLFTLLHVPEKSPHQIIQLTLFQKVKIATDIAKGMTYLHKMSPQIIHRDLKSLNILLANVIRSQTDEPLAKITDFGLSQLRSGCRSELLCQTAAVGTYHWMAPEILTSQPYNEKVDVYSFGVLLYEIFSQSIPYASPPSRYDAKQQHSPMSNPLNVALAVAQGHRPSINRISRDCPASIVTLMITCWSHDPSQRPSFESILHTLKRVAQPVNP